MLVALPMSSRCHMAAIVLCLFLAATRVGMQCMCVCVAFPGHAH